jgi:hypothetical protein
MNPIWIFVSARTAVDRIPGDRAAELHAMVRRPDAPPMPALPMEGGPRRMLRAMARRVAGRSRGTSQASTARETNPVL